MTLLGKRHDQLKGGAVNAVAEEVCALHPGARGMHNRIPDINGAQANVNRNVVSVVGDSDHGALLFHPQNITATAAKLKRQSRITAAREHRTSNPATPTQGAVVARRGHLSPECPLRNTRQRHRSGRQTLGGTNTTPPWQRKGAA